MFLLHWKFYRTLFSVHRIYNYRKNVNDFHILVKSILVPFSTFWHARLIKVRRRWKIFRKKLNHVEIRHVLYFCVLMKTIVMVKILSGIIICLIANTSFFYIVQILLVPFCMMKKKQALLWILFKKYILNQNLNLLILFDWDWFTSVAGLKLNFVVVFCLRQWQILYVFFYWYLLVCLHGDV